MVKIFPDLTFWFVQIPLNDVAGALFSSLR